MKMRTAPLAAAQVAGIVLLIHTLLPLTLEAAERTFRDREGTPIRAELQSVDGDQVSILGSNGKPYTVSIQVFSDADQAYIRKWQEERSKPADDRVKPGAAIRLTFPNLPPDRRDQPAEVNLRIPDNYDASRPVPLIVWLGGGEGGNQFGPCTALVDRTEFVMAGLPFPKGADNPNQANMVGQFDEIWEYHETMLQEIQTMIPNLDPRLRIIAGFSNGAHAIDGMLSEERDFRDFFTAYVLIEGGNGDGSYRQVRDRPIYVAWGTQGNTNQSGGQAVAKKAERAGMQLVWHAMEGVGHQFPAEEKALVREWLAKSVIPLARAETAE